MRVQRAGDAFYGNGPDEPAADHPLRLAEDDLQVGILLVDCMEAGDGRLVLHQRLETFRAAAQGEECHTGVPVVQELRHLLGHQEEAVHLVGRADMFHRTDFKSGNLFDDCFSTFMQSWENEDDYLMSDEHISEMISANCPDSLYFENGDEFNGDVDYLDVA